MHFVLGGCSFARAQQELSELVLALLGADDAMRVGIVDTEDQFAPTFVAKRHHIAQNAFAAVGGFAFPRTVVGEKSLIGFLEFDAVF